MLVTYTAPNRAHHFPYASILHRAGALSAFISGVSRFNPRARFSEPGSTYVCADHVQNVYLAALRLGMSEFVCTELAYWSKIWLDRRSLQHARKSDVFLFYSGCGLNTMRATRKASTISLVEAVNSHVLSQEALLRDEYTRLSLCFPGFHRREVERRVSEYEEADGVICPSEFVADSFRLRGMPPDRIHVVPYGFNARIAPAKSRLKKSGFRILYVGQVVVRKGVRYLLEAFEKLQHSKKELMIVGPVGRPSGIDGARIPQKVTFTGVLKGDALLSAYRDADVFVLPSVEEGLALVLGEALSNGLPIIATQNSGASNLFTDGVEGFIVPIRDPLAIATRLQQLADDIDLRERCRAAALKQADRLSGWDTNGKKLVSALLSARKLPQRN